MDNKSYTKCRLCEYKGGCAFNHNGDQELCELNVTHLDLTEHDKQIKDAVKTCDGCKHNGRWENEIEYGYHSPCTLCSRRCSDNYEVDERGTA